MHEGVSWTSLASVLRDTLSLNPPFHPPPTLLPRFHTAAVLCTAPPVLPAEYRISVYGRKPVEWDTLAAWVIQNRLYSDNNMWMIQVGAPCAACLCKHALEELCRFLGLDIIAHAAMGSMGACQGAAGASAVRCQHSDAVPAACCRCPGCTMCTRSRG